MADPEQGARRVLLVGRLILGAVTLCLLALGGRVAELQVRPPARIAALIGSQRSTYRFLGRRGPIEDRQGRVLASSVVATQLYVDPRSVREPGTFSERVGYGLGYDPAWLERRMGAKPNSRYVVIDRRIDDAKLERLPELARLAGLATEQRLVREYPQGLAAGQVIGFVNRDGRGLEGVEKLLDAELLGKPGRLGFLRDSRHRPLWVEGGGYTPAVDGDPVRLSLDLTIQSFAETELAGACQTYAAQSGELVVMDPMTGEVLAMANYPAVDPNDFGNSSADRRRNRAVTDTYEPGSTFKPFIWAKALESGLTSPTEVFDTGSEGYHRFSSGRTLRDAHAHGRVTFDEGLVQSSNIMMGMVGERMGTQRLYQAAAAWGFGRSTDSGLPGEVKGTLHPVKKWTSYTLTSVPMGQEVTVTPIQITRAFCALANGGWLVTPSIRFRDTANATATNLRTSGGGTPILERVISASAAAHTREVLRRVVIEGTGRRAQSPMYELWGKTGTAQVAGAHGGYEPDAFVSSFVCGAPLDHPRIVVACVVHRPDRALGHFGGTVAAPAARNVVEQTLVYLGVPPLPAEPSKDAQPQIARR